MSPGAVRLSVVVPTYRRADRIVRCVRSVAGAIPADAEISVSDDGSTDDTRERVLSLCAEDARVRLVQGPNIGPAGARNRGWRAARGAVVAFIDDDCTAAPGWGEALLSALAADPVLCAVEGRTEPEHEVPGFFHHSLRGGAGSYLTCNLAVRRAALEAVGGLDERFPHPHGEDLDLCFRLQEGVGPIGYAPDALVLHMVIRVGALYHLRRAKLDASTYRLFALHPTRFPAAWRTVKLPLWPRVDATHPPRFSQILLYIVLAKGALSYFSVRDGKSTPDRLIGGAVHALGAALSLTQLGRGWRAYREALGEVRAR